MKIKNITFISVKLRCGFLKDLLAKWDGGYSVPALAGLPTVIANTARFVVMPWAACTVWRSTGKLSFLLAACSPEAVVWS